MYEEENFYFAEELMNISPRIISTTFGDIYSITAGMPGQPLILAVHGSGPKNSADFYAYLLSMRIYCKTTSSEYPTLKNSMLFRLIAQVMADPEVVKRQLKHFHYSSSKKFWAHSTIKTTLPWSVCLRAELPSSMQFLKTLTSLISW